MRLTDPERQMLHGEAGEAARLAMNILVDLGQSIGAVEMVAIEHVHTDSGFYLGDAGLEFVEHLAALGGQVRVPTTMNNTSYDIERCRSYGVPPELADKIIRLEKAHMAMGAAPSWTCAPYQDGILPKPGSMVAWSESNAIVFANSVLGARTNRTGDLVDICCALTGRAPKTGLYLDENRLASIHVKTEYLPSEAFHDPIFYPLLGYYIGKHCGNQVVAISGIPKKISMEDLKGLGAAPLVMLELIKQGTAPVAIVNVETDPLLVAGPIIAKHFYNKAIPVVCLSKDDFRLLQNGKHVVVDGIRNEIIVSG